MDGGGGRAAIGQDRPGPRLDRVYGLALCVLGLGAATYFCVRDLDSLFLLQLVAPPSLLPPGLRLAVPRALTSALGSLPSATHAFALSLMTAPLLCPSRHAVVGACALWACVDIVFELFQATDPCSAAWTMTDNGLVRMACAYASRGTFDRLDVISIVAGASRAFVTLTLVPWIRHAQEVP
jgi:hypothetical protein